MVAFLKHALRHQSFLCTLCVSTAILFFAFFSLTAYAQSSDLAAECAALMVNPPPLANPPPTARIIEPADGAIIYGGQVIVAIQADNFELTQGSHWHLWVDDTLMGMVYEPRAQIFLSPGTYRLCATLGDDQHADLGIPAGITITVREALEGTPTPPADTAIAAPQPEPDSTLNPVVILLLGGAAALGGILIGARMGRRRP